MARHSGVLRVVSYVLCLASVAGLVGACGTPSARGVDAPAAAVPTEAEIEANLTVEQAESLWQQGGVVIIDVREPSEFAEGHIPGAILIPSGSVADRLEEIPTDQPVLVVCRSGNRSSQVHQLLVQHGFENVHNVRGGMIEWQAAGFDVER